MKSFTILIILCSMLFIFVVGCQSNSHEQIEIKSKSFEELQEIQETYTYDDYKEIFDEAVSKANDLEKDEQVNKRIIRILGQEKLYYETDFTDEQVIILAKQDVERDKVWKSIAEDEYGVTVTEEEIDQYIKELTENIDTTLPQPNALADSLGLTLQELNHNFDRDIYEKSVIWIKLKPELEKKYGTTNIETLLEKYEEEVKRKL